MGVAAVALAQGAGALGLEGSQGDADGFLHAFGDAHEAVQVIGHTDSQGDAAANQRLSEQRAQQVRASLVAAGLARDRVGAQGRGAAEPVADNGTAAGRAKNRRVDIIVATKN